MNKKILLFFLIFHIHAQIHGQIACNSSILSDYELTVEHLKDDFEALNLDELDISIGSDSVFNYFEQLLAIKPSEVYLDAPQLSISGCSETWIDVELEGGFDKYYLSYFYLIR